MALGVGVEEVIGARVVLVDALLHEAHAEHAGVEVEVLLRRAGDGGDVVKSVDGSHLTSIEMRRGNSQLPTPNFQLPNFQLPTSNPTSNSQRPTPNFQTTEVPTGV